MQLDNFIPDFMEIRVDSVDDETWIEIGKYNHRQPMLVLDEEKKIHWIIPKQVSSYPYSGELIEILTSSCDNMLLNKFYFKPSSRVLIYETELKAKDFQKKDSLIKYHGSHKTKKINQGLPEDKPLLFSLSFSKKYYLPVRFETDYCLIPV